MVDYKSNSIGMNNIFYPNRVDGEVVTFLHRSVGSDEVLSKLRSVNTMETNVRMPVLGFGMNMLDGDGFLSFEISTRVDAGFKLPYQLFELAKVGSGPQGAHYNMGNMTIGANAYAVSSIGYAHHLPEYDLSVGGRINLLFGIARAKIQYDRLDMEFSNNRWSVDAQGRLEVAASGAKLELDDDGYVDISDTFGNVFKDVNGFSGFGVTVDLGAEYKIMDLVTVSASILDLGYMRWGKNVITAVSDAKYSFSGFNVVDGEDHGTSDWKDLDDFAELSPSGNNDPLRPELRATFVLGANMDVPYVEKYLNFGLMFMDRKTEYIRRSELTAILTATPLDWLNAAVSYTVARQKYMGRNFINTVGLSVGTHTRGMNFFLGTDYLITKMSRQVVPAAQKAFNIYFGLSVPFGPKRYNQMK